MPRANSTGSAIVTLSHELLISPIYVTFHSNAFLVLRSGLTERPVISPTVSNAIEFSRVSPDQAGAKPRGRRSGRVHPCRAKTTRDRPSLRGILLPARRNKNFTHTVYFGESVWIPATGNTSHILRQSRCAPWPVTYLRSSCAARCARTCTFSLPIRNIQLRLTPRARLLTDSLDRTLRLGVYM